jgi:SpoVK/Ycf46/Vps4 family AAA+-type ATPase
MEKKRKAVELETSPQFCAEVDSLINYYKRDPKRRLADSPWKILIYGAAGSGKTYYAKKMCRSLNAAYVNTISFFDVDDRDRLKKLNEIFTALHASLKTEKEQKPNPFAILHCTEFDILAGVGIKKVDAVLVDQKLKLATEKKEFLFIAETDVPPPPETIIAFDKVIPIAPLSWPQRKEILSRHLSNCSIDWNKIPACLTDGMVAQQLVQIAHDALASFDAKTDFTICLENRMRYWHELYRAASSDHKDTCKFMHIYS